MKRIFILLIVCLGLQSVCSQTYQIEYEDFFTAIHGSLETIKEQLILESKNENNTIQGIKSFLTYSDGVSLHKDESIVKDQRNENKSSESEIYNTRLVRPVYYKDKNKNLLKIKYTNHRPVIYGEDILIEDQLPKLDWTITNIKEKVSGYNCTLAKGTTIGGLPVIVWYTDEIALNEGPREYQGLPGLIIQVQINNAVLIVAKSIKKLKKSIIIEEPKEGNKMTIKEFYLFENEMKKPRVVKLPNGQEVYVNQKQ